VKAPGRRWCVGLSERWWMSVENQTVLGFLVPVLSVLHLTSSCGVSLEEVSLNMVTEDEKHHAVHADIMSSSN